MWAREPRDAQGGRGGLNESMRWIECHERLAEWASEVPSRLVLVGDRKSDILALFERGQSLSWPVDVLVRSQHNRRLPDKALLWDEVQRASRSDASSSRWAPAPGDQGPRRAWCVRSCVCNG